MATQVTPRSAPPPQAPRSHARRARPSGFRNWLYRVDVKGSPYAYVSPFFVLYVVFGLAPVVYTGYMSLTDWDLVKPTRSFVGLQNYRDLLADDQFWNALQNTFTILLLATIPQMLLALGLAAILNTRLRGQGIWRMAMLLPNVASVVAVAVIFSQLFGREFGMINWVLSLFGVGKIDWVAGTATSQIAIAVMITWRWTGYNALIFLASMQTIPAELYESARLDGATALQQFRKITVPMIRPTVIFITITSVIYGLQIFAEPQIFGGPGDGGTTGGTSRQFQTLTLFLYEWWGHNKYGKASAIAYATFVVVLIVTAINYLLIRRIRSNR